MRVAQEEQPDSQGTEMPQQRVPVHRQDAVASGARRRQVQLGVLGVQEKGAREKFVLLRRLQVRTRIRPQSHGQ